MRRAALDQRYGINHISTRLWEASVRSRLSRVTCIPFPLPARAIVCCSGVLVYEMGKMHARKKCAPGRSAKAKNSVKTLAYIRTSTATNKNRGGKARATRAIAGVLKSGKADETIHEIISGAAPLAKRKLLVDLLSKKTHVTSYRGRNSRHCSESGRCRTIVRAIQGDRCPHNVCRGPRTFRLQCQPRPETHQTHEIMTTSGASCRTESVTKWQAPLGRHSAGNPRSLAGSRHLRSWVRSPLPNLQHSRSTARSGRTASMGGGCWLRKSRSH